MNIKVKEIRFSQIINKRNMPKKLPDALVKPKVKSKGASEVIEPKNEIFGLPVTNELFFNILPPEDRRVAKDYFERMTNSHVVPKREEHVPSYFVAKIPTEEVDAFLSDPNAVKRVKNDLIPLLLPEQA